MQIVVANITAWLLLLMGLSVLLNARGWQALFVDMFERPHRLIPLFLFFLLFGLFIVTQHNIWRGQGIVVSLVGWASVVKSTLFLAAPQLLQPFKQFAGDDKLPLMRLAGGFWVVVGAWLVLF